jgi:hypothetical protein
VAAQHHDDCALLPRGARYGIDDELEVAGDENVGERRDEISEGASRA